MEIKEITFHTAIYNNVTLKLKCITRKIQDNDTIPLYMDANILLGRLLSFTLVFCLLSAVFRKGLKTTGLSNIFC